MDSFLQRSTGEPLLNQTICYCSQKQAQANDQSMNRSGTKKTAKPYFEEIVALPLASWITPQKIHKRIFICRKIKSTTQRPNNNAGI
jgi:hypothetical protein